MSSPPDSLVTPPGSTERSVCATDAATSTSRKLRHAGILAALLVILGAAFGLIPRWRHQTALAAATHELAIQTVTVVSPVPGKSGGGLVLPAEVKPYAEALIYPRANGYIKNWLVDIGSRVKEGDVLAEIDTPELNQELAQARAQLAQSEAALALAKTTAARWAELVKSASVSEQEAAEKKADLDLKLANVEAARANVSRLEELQRFQNVKAPFDGTITMRGTEIGQLVSPGSSRELFRIVQTRTLRVFIRVPQTASRGVVPGKMAELMIPEIPDRVFPAKVVRTAGTMSADSRTLMAELEVDNSKHEILAGSYAQVRFAEADLRSALTLPSNTLLFRPEGPSVGVVGADGKVELRTVTLGRDFGPTIEILSGVATNDQVILNPPDSLVNGATVRVASKSQPRMDTNEH